MMRLLAALCCMLAPAAAGTNKLSTWVTPGGGGPMGDDITAALAWVTAHKEQISSLSIIGFGPGGADNVTAPQFNAGAGDCLCTRALLASRAIRRG